MKSSKLVIGLALLLLGGLAGYFIGAGYPVFEDKEVPEDTEDASAKTETVEKQVNNEKFGISFSYPEGPEGYVLVEPVATEDATVWALIATKEWEELQASEAGREGPTAMTIAIFPIPAGFPIEEWLASDQSLNFKLGVTETSPAVVGGESGISYRWSGLYEGETTAVTHGDYVYLFSVTFIENSDSIYSDFGKLLDGTSFSS